MDEAYFLFCNKKKYVEEKTLIKVAYIHQDGLITGSALSLFQILTSIDSRKFKLKVFCQGNGPFVDLLIAKKINCSVVEGLRFISSPTPSFFQQDFYYNLLALKRNRKLETALKNFNPDIVHVNDKSALAAGKAAKKLGYKVVWHLRSSYFGKRSKLLYNISRNIISKNSDHLISISEDELDGFENYKNISIIYNSLNLKEVEKTLAQGSNFKTEFGVSREEVAVGMVGNLNKQKGAWNFLKAAGMAQKIAPQVKFRFFIIAPIEKNLNYGWKGKLKLIDTTNPYEKAVAIAKENNILKNTHFTNRRKDIFNVIAGLDIVTACYNLYAIGRPGFEAAAVGKPVIVNKGHTGNSQIVKNNVTGLVIEREDSEALAKAIIHLAVNKELRISMGKNGIEHARQNFDAEKNIKKIEAIYKQVLNEK